MQNGPLGLNVGDVSGLFPQLPHHRGMLRIAGYYQLGRHIMVVFDVFDDQDKRVTALRTAYPADLPYLPPGTPYLIGDGSVRCAKRLRMPRASKRATRRRRVRSGTPVSWARRGIGCPNSTIGRSSSYASCSGEATRRRT